MTTDHDEVPRTLSCAALRTLHELQRKLRMQINELWDNASETQRRLLRDESLADPVVG